MSLSTVIVCELGGRWAAGLRRALEPDRFRLRETRRLVDCEVEFLAAPASLLVLEWSGARRAELATFLDHLMRRFPLAQAVVVADRSDARDQWLAREAGAMHFIGSPRAIAALARLVRRHPPPAARADEDPVQQIRKMLS